MFQNILNLIFPKCCLGCNTILLTSEIVLCTTCRIDLPFTFQHKSTNTNLHTKFYGKLKVEHAFCLLYYNKGGFIQHLFHQLKYNNHPEVSYFLGKLFATQLESTPYIDNIDEIVVVPIHKAKRKKRGYNQVDGFAKAMSETYGIPVNKNLLLKTSNTDSQTTKTRNERSLRKKEVFEVICASKDDEGKHFLVLDDILTTGATLEACCKKLLQIPNSKVTILCLAETV